MKYRWDKKYLYWGVTAFLVIAASILLYYFLFHSNNIKAGLSAFLSVCMPIIDGLVLAYLLTPIVNHMDRDLFIPICKKVGIEITEKVKKSIRVVSSAITVILLFLILYLFASMIIPQLIESIQSIAVQFPSYVNNLESWLNNILNNDSELSNMVIGLLNQYSTELEEFLNSKLVPELNIIIKQFSSSIFSSVLSFLLTIWNFIIGLIISIYLLISKETFAGQAKKTIYAIFPEENANHLIKNIRFVNRTFGGFINGKLLDSLIIGILCFIGMTIFHFPYPVLISVIIGITNVIPFFGPYIGAIPSTILILMVNPKQALFFVIFILVLQQFDGNFLGPKILGNKTGLSSFWVIFAITFFGGYFGVIGMAIGVPVFAVIYAGTKSLLNKSLKKKGLSTQTKEYMNLSEIRGNEYIELPPPKKNEFRQNDNMLDALNHKLNESDYNSKDKSISYNNPHKKVDSKIDPDASNKKDI